MDVTSFTTPSGDHVMVKDAAARQSIAALRDAIAAIPDVDVNANTLEIVNAINLLLSKFRPTVACLAVAALSALQLAAGVIPKTSPHNRIDGDIQIVTNTVELISDATNELAKTTVPTSRKINGQPLTDDITIPTSEPESYETVSNAAMTAAEAIPGLQGDVSTLQTDVGTLSSDVSDLYNSKVSTSYGSADNLSVSGLSVSDGFYSDTATFGYSYDVYLTYYSHYYDYNYGRYTWGWHSGTIDDFIYYQAWSGIGGYYDDYGNRILNLYADSINVSDWSSIYNYQTGNSLAGVLSAYESTIADINEALSMHVADEENPHRVTPAQIGAITPSYVSTNNPVFVAEVMAVGMHIDPAVLAEFNEAARRGNLASNIVFHVHRYFEDTQRAHYYFDPVLQRTWRISVSNGCFFGEIVDDDVKDR